MSDRFDEAMRRLAAESRNLDAPPEIESALLAEFDRVKRRKRGFSWMIAAGAIASAVVIVLSLEHRPAPQPLTPIAAVPEDVRESEQPFVPIPYVVPLGPYERAEIVRMQVPVAALISAGLPMRTADPGARAEADVLVGQDGRARAIRLISISRLN